MIPSFRALRAPVVLALVAVIALSACTKKSERVLFNGNYYPTKAKTVDKGDRKSFAVSVRRVDQGLAGAKEAGRHGGKTYCLQNYGTSEIEWAIGPDTPDTALDLSGGRLVFRGACVLW